MARAKIIFESKTCPRCQGTGRYSYNQMDGDICFGCHGQKVVITKAAKASQDALKALRASLVGLQDEARWVKVVDAARALPGCRIAE